MYIVPVQIKQDMTIGTSKPVDNSAGQSMFFKALQGISSMFLSPVSEKDRSSEPSFKKLSEKTGKKEKLRTIYDAIAEIEAIEKRILQGKN